jgi:broad specificity phosphatase PhoE
VFVVLHGQTEWNREGRLQGHADSSLTEVGRDQARAVARTLRARGVGSNTYRIVCSPLGRTRETARIIADDLGFDAAAISDEPLLKEVSVGSWEGLTRAQVEAIWPQQISGSSPHNWCFRSPDGETYADLAARLSRWLASNPYHDDLVVVTHGVASRVLRGPYGNYATDEALRFEINRADVLHLTNGHVVTISSAV